MVDNRGGKGETRSLTSKDRLPVFLRKKSNYVLMIISLMFDKSSRRKPGQWKWIGNFCLATLKRGRDRRGRCGKSWKMRIIGCKWRGDNEIHIKIICWKEKSQVELDSLMSREFGKFEVWAEIFFAQRVEVF